MSSTTRRYAGRMTERTLCFLLRSESPRQVLLGLKKTGFGANKYAGIGGKVEAGETVTQAAVREVAEEIGVRVQECDLEEAGHLTFLFPARPAWSQVVHVFVATAWSGEPVESTEMKPFCSMCSTCPLTRCGRTPHTCCRLSWPPKQFARRSWFRLTTKPSSRSIDICPCW